MTSRVLPDSVTTFILSFSTIRKAPRKSINKNSIFISTGKDTNKRGTFSIDTHLWFFRPLNGDWNAGIKVNERLGLRYFHKRQTISLILANNKTQHTLLK
jgi:hypothetical protein